MGNVGTRFAIGFFLLLAKKNNTSFQVDRIFWKFLQTLKAKKKKKKGMFVYLFVKGCIEHTLRTVEEETDVLFLRFPFVVLTLERNVKT